jgi:poly(glycerol-phosphate) alpha-glucosyltransferase
VVRGLKNSSGTTHIVVPLSEAQARLGCEVSVYFVEQGGETPVFPDPELVSSRCFPASLPLYHPGVSLPFARAIARDVSAFDFVHIHAIWNFPTWWTMRAAHRAKVPFMVAPQGSLEPWALRRHQWRKALYARATELPLMSQAAYMQALSQAEAAQFKAAGVTAPSVIVPNGVEPSWFGNAEVPPLARQLGLPDGARTLLSLSRLDPKKGIDILIRGFARAKRQDDLWLVIAGQDAGSGYRGTLEQVVQSEGVADRVIFAGELQGQRKYDALLGADAFALISHSEGLPVACIEAMAAGAPVIITPGCNLPEVAEYEAGLIVFPNPNEAAEAIFSLFSNISRARDWGANGRRLVERCFTWSAIARTTIELYGAAAERGGARRVGGGTH